MFEIKPVGRPVYPYEYTTSNSVCRDLRETCVHSTNFYALSNSDATCPPGSTISRINITLRVSKSQFFSLRQLYRHFKTHILYVFSSAKSGCHVNWETCLHFITFIHYETRSAMSSNDYDSNYQHHTRSLISFENVVFVNYVCANTHHQHLLTSEDLSIKRIWHESQHMVIVDQKSAILAHEAILAFLGHGLALKQLIFYNW